MATDKGIQSETNGMAEATTIRTLEDIRRLRPQIMELARRYRAQKVSVFGSCVRGEMEADSDIDFLVDFEEGGARLTDHILLLQDLRELLACEIDLVDRRVLRTEFCDRVLAEVQEL
ncbi:MAG: nucleotidyltransferase domain-containing protein [Chloroflexi bacterium]|nr:nucleotidyltransferase domain-containing protein [Chloroflexota bacterium]